jgi:hypothetical protein
MQSYNFPNTIRGDSFDGVLFTVTVNGTPLDLSNAEIQMDLRLAPTSPIIKHFAVGTGFTIAADPTTGVFSFDSWSPVNVDVANYYYDIQITLDNGEIKTYISGRWNILQDITYPDV